MHTSCPPGGWKDCCMHACGEMRCGARAPSCARGASAKKGRWAGPGCEKARAPRPPDRHSAAPRCAASCHGGAAAGRPGCTSTPLCGLSLTRPLQANDGTVVLARTCRGDVIVGQAFAAYRLDMGVHTLRQQALRNPAPWMPTWPSSSPCDGTWLRHSCRVPASEDTKHPDAPRRISSWAPMRSRRQALSFSAQALDAATCASSSCRPRLKSVRPAPVR